MTGLRKIPQNVLRKIVALVLWIRGRGDRIEENSSKCFEKNGCFSSLDLRKRWQDWGKFLKMFRMVALVLWNWGEETGLRIIVAIVLWIWGRGDRIEENSSKCFEENGSFSTLDLRRRWQDLWKSRTDRRQEKSNF